MTYRERMKQLHPAWTGPVFVGGCRGCPGSIVNGASVLYGENCLRDCRACWDQEMPGSGQTKKTVYIAGPITGVTDYKRPFNRTENELIVAGHTVLNPSKLPEGMDPSQYMRICLAMIDAADAVVLLPKWEESLGARLELDYCRYIGKPVYFSAEALTGEGVT